MALTLPLPSLHSILFDLGDVLLKLRWDKLHAHLLQTIQHANPSSKLKENINIDSILQNAVKALAAPGAELYEAQFAYFAGTMPPSTFLPLRTRSLINTCFESPESVLLPPLEAQISAWKDLFDPWYEMMDLAEEIHRNGYPYFILSNTCEIHWTVLKEKETSVHPRLAGILENATGHWLSYKVGLSKPDERYWTSFLDAHGLTKEECLFIDDNEDNVDAARRVGLRALRHYREDISTLRTWLAGNNVLISGYQVFG